MRLFIKLKDADNNTIVLPIDAIKSVESAGDNMCKVETQTTKDFVRTWTCNETPDKVLSKIKAEQKKERDYANKITSKTTDETVGK